MHRLVIVGGGFGGINVARELKNNPDIDITLVDKRNFHLFQPLLYQVATGSLSPGEIAAPLRSVFRRSRNVRVLLGEAVDVDIQARKVILSDGELPYDTAVFASGSQNFYFGHDDWRKYATGLKTIEDATEIRGKILMAFEEAERELDPDRRRAWLTFLVVGAGPTGVELAGALGEIANDTLRNEFRSINPKDARILLLDGSPRMLPSYDASLSAAAEKQLISLGVRARNNVRVVGVDEHGVELDAPTGHERIESRTVIWAAGVMATPIGRKIAERVGIQTDRGGRILVAPDLTVPGHPELIVIGDLAAMSQDGHPLPGVAPVAMQQGRYAGRLIRKRLRNQNAPPPFRYFDKGSLAVIGRASAVAQFGSLTVHGLVAWLLWLFIHLMYIVQFHNRVLIFIQWGFEYLTYNRGARLITSPDEMEPPPRPAP